MRVLQVVPLVHPYPVELHSPEAQEGGLHTPLQPLLVPLLQTLFPPQLLLELHRPLLQATSTAAPTKARRCG